MTTHVLFAARTKSISKPLKMRRHARALIVKESKENDDLKISNDVIGVAAMLGSRISGFDASESKNHRATGLAFQ